MAKRGLLAVAVCVVTAAFLFTAIMGPPAKAELVVRGSALPDPIGKYSRNGTQGDNGWYKSQVILSVVTNGSVNYSVNEGEWLPFPSFPGSLVFTEDGIYKIVFVGYVNATTNETLRVEIKIDTIVPSTTSSYSNETLKCTLASTDAMSGVAKTFYRVDGGKWMNYYGPFRPKTGAHMVEYYSKDAAGNSEPTKNITFNVVFNVKMLEVGLVIGLLAVGLAAFFIVVLRARKRPGTAPEEKPSRLE